MAFEIDPRIEVYSPGGQHLLLKQTDLTVTRLSRVFKVLLNPRFSSTHSEVHLATNNIAILVKAPECNISSIARARQVL